MYPTVILKLPPSLTPPIRATLTAQILQRQPSKVPTQLMINKLPIHRTKVPIRRRQLPRRLPDPNSNRRLPIKTTTPPLTKILLFRLRRRHLTQTLKLKPLTVRRQAQTSRHKINPRLHRTPQVKPRLLTTRIKLVLTTRGLTKRANQIPRIMEPSLHPNLMTRRRITARRRTMLIRIKQIIRHRATKLQIRPTLPTVTRNKIHPITHVTNC